MKLFQSVQNFCRTMGFFPSKSRPNCLRVRWTTLLYIIPPILFMVSSVTFLRTKANSLPEYEELIFIISSVISTLWNFGVLILNMPKVLRVIGKFEESIEKSEPNVFVLKKSISLTNFLSIDRDDSSNFEGQVLRHKPENWAHFWNVLLGRC